MIVIDKKFITMAVSGIFAVIILVYSCLMAVGSRVEKILLFPHDITGSIIGEPRLMPRRRNTEMQISDLLREVILGSRLPEVARTVPRNVKIQAMKYGKGTVYVDFSEEMIFSLDNLPLTFTEILSVMEWMLKFNFPVMEDFVITVDGELPIQD